jgi:hypothetical protein
MLRLVARTLETAQTSTAAVIGAAARLESHEKQAVEGFLKNPNGKNVNLLATYASVESETIEQTFDTMPDLLVWKEEGKWQLLFSDWT